MSDDLFPALVSTRDSKGCAIFSSDPCALCVSGGGEYSWDNTCCRARFVIGLPGIEWRRGWMARWKSSEIPAFYSAIEQAVKTSWEAKIGALNV